MSKIIVLIIFICVVICTGLPRDQDSGSEDKNESEEDKYELESKQDFDRTSEKEKEMKLLRKANLKENNYRRALENILPVKNSESYRRLFKDLINDSNEQSKFNDIPRKAVDDVVVTDTFTDDNGTEGKDSEPQIEEIEVVIERITEDDNEKDGNKNTNEPSLVSRNPSSYESEDRHMVLQENHSSDTTIESKHQEQLLEDVNVDDKATGRMAKDYSATQMDAMRMGHLAERRVIESYPVSRFSEVVIPHYRTTLTRSGMVVTPAVYTVKTSAPIIDHVTTRSWIPNTRILSDIYGRSNTPGSANTLIDEYKDYGGNAYSYSPSRSLFAPQQADNKMGIHPKLARDSLQQQLGNMEPLKENLRARTFYSQPQQFYPNSYRPMFNIHR